MDCLSVIKVRNMPLKQWYHLNVPQALITYNITSAISVFKNFRWYGLGTVSILKPYGALYPAPFASSFLFSLLWCGSATVLYFYCYILCLSLWKALCSLIRELSHQFYRLIASIVFRVFLALYIDTGTFKIFVTDLLKHPLPLYVQ